MKIDKIRSITKTMAVNNIANFVLILLAAHNLNNTICFSSLIAISKQILVYKRIEEKRKKEWVGLCELFRSCNP